MDSWFHLCPRWGSINFHLLVSQVWFQCLRLHSPRVLLPHQTNSSNLLSLFAGSLHETGPMDLGMQVGVEQASHLPLLQVWVWFLGSLLNLTLF